MYGLCDSGDYWGVTINAHVTNELGMTSLYSDSAMFMKQKNGKLIGLCGVQVDHSLNAGNEEFEKLTQLTLKKFDSKPWIYDLFEFFEMQIKAKQNGDYYTGQPYYAKNLSYVPKDATFDEFRRHRALFSWIVNTRPDAALCAKLSAQVSSQTFSRDKINFLKRAIKRVQKCKELGLTFSKLEKSTIQLRVYSDASFACNDDLSSQLGHLILLFDIENNAHVLDYASPKSKRVVRSIMAGEVCAFLDAYDAAIVIAKDLHMLLGSEIHLIMFTDSKQLFDALTRGKRTTEKRLMIDTTIVREAYNRLEIYAVGLIRGEQNPSEALTKENNNGVLDELLTTGKDNTKVDLWIEHL